MTGEQCRRKYCSFQGDAIIRRCWSNFMESVLKKSTVPVENIYQFLGVKPVISATGTVTAYGGSKLRSEVIDVMNKASQTMVSIDELNLAAGKLIAAHTGAEAGLVTSGAAGGLVLQAAAVVAGVTFGAIVVLTEVLWMEYIVEKPWLPDAIMAGLPWVLAAGALSGWIGWAIGGIVKGLGSPGSVWTIFGGWRRGRLVLAGVVVLTLVGLASAYRHGSVRPPAPLRAFGLIAGEKFDYVDAVFW